MGKLKFVLLFFVSLSVAGCLASTPVKREQAQVNFEYQFKEQVANNGKTIAVIAPDINGLQINRRGRPTNASRQLVDALSESIVELFNKKGFNIKGPIVDKGNLTYSDKKKIYLTAEPKVDLLIQEANVDDGCVADYCTKKGEYVVSGQFVLAMREPMSDEAIIYKRINLSDLNITKKFMYQRERRVEGGLVGNLIATATSNKPEQLVDSRAKARGDVLNEFFSGTMEKLERLISHKELLAYTGDVEGLKRRKRY